MPAYREINGPARRWNAVAEWLRRGLSPRFLWYRALWNWVARHDLVLPFPLHLDLELTEACNLKCVMCVHGTTGVADTGMMDMAFARRMISEAAAGGVRSIKFNWRGEPALHTGLEELVAYAKRQGILEVQINTNGIPFTEERIRALIEAGLDRVIFSMDGATRATYERIRVGASFDKLMRNIQRFHAIRASLGRVRPFIRIQMVRMRDNREEVAEFMRMWRGVADDIAVKDVTDRGQGGHLFVGDQVTTGRRRCNQPWQRMIVARDGKVFPCCSDWYRTYEIGDAAVTPLREIWRGGRMEALRDINRQGKLDSTDPCKDCFVTSSYEWRRLSPQEQLAHEQEVLARNPDAEVAALDPKLASRLQERRKPAPGAMAGGKP
jgi:radical SAM protein with 4Fe4S-binding SPASM domain